MSFPTLQSGRVDTLVSNILQAYTNPNFIASQILPPVSVVEESGKIGAISNNHLRVYTSKRGVYDENQHRMEFKYTQDDSYQIDYCDLEVYVPDRLAKQVQKPFDARRDAGVVVLQALMLEREAALATLMTNTSILTQNTTLSGTSLYTDFVNSTPEDDFETARTAIQQATGREANSVYMSRKVFNTLKRHPFFLNLVKGVRVLSGSVLQELIKDYFEVKNVIIGSAIKLTTNEGQSETKGQVWGNDVVFFYRPDSASLFEPSFGYQFTLTGQTMRADLRRHENDLGDIVRNMWAYQDKILDTSCAYLIKSAV